VSVRELLADRDDALILGVVPKGSRRLDVGEMVDDRQRAQLVPLEALMQTHPDRCVLARLPTFPTATMSEVVDVRDELSRPLVRFRAEMVSISRGTEVDALDPDFERAAADIWVERVRPALIELDELVREKRLARQFVMALPGGGVAGVVGGLITGVMTGTPIAGTSMAAATASAVGATSAAFNRPRVEQEIRRRPYYLLHLTGDLLQRDP
jgi:hypothetical protein